MGLDYRLRGIMTQNNDMDNSTSDSLNYYSHSARFYMTSWLNEDVEASMRLQSINIWGQEGSTTPLQTRYPDANGAPWVEEAYIHLPHMFWKKVDVVLGRQEIVLGDGLIVSDDDMGFNAIRMQAELPWRFDLDVFTAKINESLRGAEDFDLNGAVLGTDRRHNRWEFGWIQEQNRADSTYVIGGGTAAANGFLRRFYDIRLYGNLKDAYYKLEYAMQSGEANMAGGTNVKLKGHAEKLELGAQTDNVKWGRFGVRALYALGSGDDMGTPNQDEAFRPTFSKRWDGLQRSGFGRQYAATVSDAYSNSDPFSPTATGLPPGFSGIKTMGLGIFSTQGVKWTGAIDYFLYNALTKPTGKNDLGAELDAAVTFRYTGFVTFELGAAYFFPGEAYGELASRVTRYTAEANVHF